MHTDLLDMKLGVAVLLATLSGAVATSPLDHAVLQYGALGILAFSIIWMFKVVIPQFLNRFFDSHRQHIDHLTRNNDRLDDRLGRLTQVIEEHSTTNKQLVEKVSGLIDTCPMTNGGHK
jgi:hypothetical protein